MRWALGKAGKAGKQVRPEPVPAGRPGRQSGGNALPGPSVVYGANPVAVSQALRLHVGTALTSPAVAGRFRPGDRGSAVHRGVDGGAPDLGVLQSFRGAVSAVRSVRVGAQSGPSSQPGYPSTNGAGGLLASLAGMDRPDVQRFGGLR